MNLRDIVTSKVIDIEHDMSLIATHKGRKILIPWTDLRKVNEFRHGDLIHAELVDRDSEFDFIARARYKNCLVYNPETNYSITKDALEENDVIKGKIVGTMGDFVKVRDLGDFASGLVHVIDFARALGYGGLDREDMQFIVGDYLRYRDDITPSSSEVEKAHLDYNLVCVSRKPHPKPRHGYKGNFESNFVYMFNFKDNIQI